ncbi:MAG: hypothetical protein AB1749_16855 [Pseudomonadota bacterium]
MLRGVPSVGLSRTAIAALALALAGPALAEQEMPTAPAAAPAAGGSSGPSAAGGPAGVGGTAVAPVASGEPEFIYDRGPRPQDPEIRVAPPLGDDHPLVRPFVEANPGKDLVLCLAGCRREPGIVSARATTRGARAATVSEHVPKAAAAAPAGRTTAPASAAPRPAVRMDCIAGC